METITAQVKRNYPPGDIAIWIFIMAELAVFAIFFAAYAWVGIRVMKQLIHSMGRKIVMEIDPGIGDTKNLQLTFMISSVPKTVPKWLS